MVRIASFARRQIPVFVVTGANGFIGSAMIWELNHRGHTDIIAVDRILPSENNLLLKSLKYSRFISADEFPRFLESSGAANLRAVFHMGACSSTTEMNTEFLRQVNTDYTKTVFQAAKRLGFSLLYASSGAVYGGGEFGFDDRTESSKFKPLNPYGWSKAHFDVWAEAQAETPRHWYGLRFFNVYGPNEYLKGDMSSVVFKAFKQIRETGELKLFRSHRPDYEDGKQLRDFVYVKDITGWMWTIFSNPKVQSGIYNMGFGQARTWLDLAQAVFQGLDKPMKINWIDMPESIRNQYQYFTQAEMSKLQAQGLSAPQWSLEKGVADYIRNYLLQDDPYLR